MEEIARQVGPARIDIAHERLGPRDPPVVLLIMGGGAQMISWPDDFCDTLVGRVPKPMIVKKLQELAG